ncbi:hypothetical protein OR1_03522 [Geobacter sp. OR-1]|uniref:hypothetical protein n=1 Tax=Geobacter sp. OR-1 TaxID=1266765 RepID=UPI000541E7A0|nr:hypothetical protein [Geobacter sp. OR-1]GAM11211.1 hypothetical protein OR1_03522 [Geobacter sp. OR-1]
MKCPKCGYNSFEYLDSCKKCGNSLATFKESLGIKTLVLPAGITAVASATLSAEAEQQVPASSGDDIFQWDTTSPPAPPTPPASDGPSSDDFEINFGEEPGQEPQQNSDPFSFDEQLPEETSEKQGATTKDLLEELSLHLPDRQQAPTPPPQPEEQAASLNITTDAFGDFSLDLPTEQQQEIALPDESIPSFATEQTDDQDSSAGVFGEFAFDLSEQQPVLPQETGPAEVPASQDAADNIFGEFAFDDNVADQPADAFDRSEGSSEALADAEFPFDPFSDLDGGDTTGKGEPQLAGTAGEFDLEGFLMDLPEPQQSGTANNVDQKSPQLTGSEFDALFGEPDEKKK